MSTEYYSHLGYPVARSSGVSSLARSEFAAVEDGFAKLVTLTGNGGRIIRIADDASGHVPSVSLYETALGLVISGTVTVSCSTLTWSGNPTHTGNHTFSGTVTFSSVLGGTPTAPTAPTGTSTTQIATTAFVQDAIAGVNASSAMPTLTISSSTSINASSGQHIVATNAAQSEVVMPPSPVAGNLIWVTFTNGRYDNVINFNGKKHMGLSDATMTVDAINATVQWRYIDASTGWALV